MIKQSTQNENAFIEFLNLLSTNFQKRKLEEINLIASIISKTYLLESIKKQQSPDFNTDNLINNYCLNMQIKEVKKNEILFRVGDPVDNVYLILKGCMSVLKPIQKKILISYKEYFLYLLKLNHFNEDYLLFHTIKMNKEILHLNSKEEIFELQLVFLKYSYKKDDMKELFIKNNFEISDFRILFSKYGLTLDDLKIEENVLEKLIESRNKIIFEEKKILNSLNMLMNRKTGAKNSNTNNNPNKSEIKPTVINQNPIEDKTLAKKVEKNKWIEYIHEKLQFNKKNSLEFDKHRDFLIRSDLIILFAILSYENSLDLFSNQIFGDPAFEKSMKNRSATIKAGADCTLIWITNEIYELYIINEKSRLRLKEVSFLHENYFFNSVEIKFLAKKYFDYFTLFEQNREYLIQKQSDSEKNIYFIKEGILQITITSNLMDLDILQKTLIKNYFLAQNYYDKEEHEKLKKQFLIDFKLKNRSEAFIERLQKQKIFKIFKLSEKEMCGIEPIFLQMNNYYNIRVHSEKAKLYKISEFELKEIFMSEDKAKDDFSKISQVNLYSLLKRLKEIISTSVQLIEDFLENDRPIRSPEKTKSAVKSYHEKSPLYPSPQKLFRETGTFDPNNFTNSISDRKFNNESFYNDKLNKNTMSQSQKKFLISYKFFNSNSNNISENTNNINKNNIGNNQSNLNSFTNDLTNNNSLYNNQNNNLNEYYNIGNVNSQAINIDDKLSKKIDGKSKKDSLKNLNYINNSTKIFNSNNNFNSNNTNCNTKINYENFVKINNSSMYSSNLNSKENLSNKNLFDMMSNVKNLEAGKPLGKSSETLINKQNEKSFTNHKKSKTHKNGISISDLNETNTNNNSSIKFLTNKILKKSANKLIPKNDTEYEFFNSLESKKKKKIEENSPTSKITISEESDEENKFKLNNKINTLLYKITENDALGEPIGAQMEEMIKNKAKLDNFNKRYLNSELKNFLNDPLCNFNNTNNYNVSSYNYIDNITNEILMNKTKDTLPQTNNDFQSKGFNHLNYFENLIEEGEENEKKFYLKNNKNSAKVFCLENVQLKKLRETQSNMKSSFPNVDLDNYELNENEKSNINQYSFINQNYITFLNDLRFKDNFTQRQLKQKIYNNPGKVILKKIEKYKSSNSVISYDKSTKLDKNKSRNNYVHQGSSTDYIQNNSNNINNDNHSKTRNFIEENNLDKKPNKDESVLSKLNRDYSVASLAKSSRTLKPLTKILGEFSNVQFFQDSIEQSEKIEKIKFYEKKVKLKHSLNPKLNSNLVTPIKFLKSRRNKSEISSTYIGNRSNIFATEKNNKIFEKNSEKDLQVMEEEKTLDKNLLIIDTDDIKPNTKLNDIEIYDKKQGMCKKKEEVIDAVRRYFRERNSKGIKNYLGRRNSFVKSGPLN